MPGGTLSSEPSFRPVGSQGLQTLIVGGTSHALKLLTSVVVAKALGPAGRGEFVLLIGVGILTYQLSSLGVERAAFRIWGEYPYDRPALWKSVTVLSATTSLPAVGLAFFLCIGPLAALVGRPSVGVLAIVLFGVPLLMHTLLLSGLHNAMGRLERTNTSFLAGVALSSGILILLALFGRLSVATGLAAVTIGHAVTWLRMLLGARPHLAHRHVRTVTSRLVRNALALAPSSALLNLSARLDLFLVSHLAGLATVGIYSVALAVSQVLWLATDALGTAVGVRQVGETHAGLADVTAKSVRMAATLTLLAGTPLVLAGPWLVEVGYGDEFRSAGVLLFLLVPAAGVTAIWRTASAAVLRLRGAKAQAASSGLSLAVVVIGNLLLVPPFGAVGAAAAALAAAMSGALVTLAYLLRSTELTARELAPGRAEIKRLIDLVATQIG